MIRSLKFPTHIKKIANKGLTIHDIFIENEHLNMTIQLGNVILHAVSFYEEDDNILFTVLEEEYQDIVIKYTDDIGILNHTFINNFINTHPNFFTSVYVFEQVNIPNFKLPIANDIDEDGNTYTLQERFSLGGEHPSKQPYIEIIERVDGDLLHYPHEVTLENLKSWFSQLWTMYTYLHKYSYTYDDIKPNNIGYIIKDNKIMIKMIDLESIRKINADITINRINSGMYKTSKYFTLNNYLYSSIDILSMIFALFNVYCKHDFNLCLKTLSELMGYDCSIVEEHFFNFKDTINCSNYKFVFIVYTLYWMTKYCKPNTTVFNFINNDFNNYLIKNNIPAELACIFSNMALFIYLKGNDMLIFETRSLSTDPINPSNIQKIFGDYNIRNVSNVGNGSRNTDCINNIIKFVAKDVKNVFDNYRQFIIDSMDANTFKYVAKMLY